MMKHSVSAGDKQVCVFTGKYQGIHYARYSGNTVFLFCDAKRLRRIGVTTIQCVTKV